jgi:hypothetical protein
MNLQLATLEQQREEFLGRKLLAMPLAGLFAWLVIAISGLTLSDSQMVWVTFVSTGSIVYLGMLFSRFTGENFIEKRKQKNAFDTLFLLTVGMSLLVYSIAIPFFMVDHTSLPLTVGILSGLMWMPLSWIINHWVGLFHSIARTVSIVTLWYWLPSDRFVSIPFCIVAIYVVTIIVLMRRNIHPRIAQRG